MKDVITGFEEHYRVLTACFINGLFSAVQGEHTVGEKALSLETHTAGERLFSHSYH